MTASLYCIAISTCRYLGSSWASGIVTLFGLPYPNGRNQESSSESVAAYEAVALYGLTCSQLFAGGYGDVSLVVLLFASE